MLASVFAARRTTAHVAQSVEHLHGKQKVSGSIPLVGSITRIANGRVSRKVLSTSPLVF
jgi:acyl-CoA synthetase (AMP-forming)/AMP-acid ligase II